MISLENKYIRFEDYKEQTIEDIFPDEVLQRAVKLNARVMESCVLINTGLGAFHLIPDFPSCRSPVLTGLRYCR